MPMGCLRHAALFESPLRVRPIGFLPRWKRDWPTGRISLLGFRRRWSIRLWPRFQAWPV